MYLGILQILKYLQKQEPCQTTLKFPENWLEDLAEITRHFWRVRYPDFQKFVYTSKETVEPTYSKTQEVFTWIKQQLLKI